jgi:hypothetical protein
MVMDMIDIVTLLLFLSYLIFKNFIFVLQKKIITIHTIHIQLFSRAIHSSYSVGLSPVVPLGPMVATCAFSSPPFLST